MEIVIQVTVEVMVKVAAIILSVAIATGIHMPFLGFIACVLLFLIEGGVVCVYTSVGRDESRGQRHSIGSPLKTSGV